MPSAYEGTDIIMSAANNKVPGYPLEIFDFVSGSGSYIMLAKQVYHTACRISYRVSDISLKSAAKRGIICSINKNLTVNFHSTIGLFLLTKPMVGVFCAK